MASEEELSPEEKLLKVIQQAKSGDGPAPRQGAPATAQAGKKMAAGVTVPRPDVERGRSVGALSVESKAAGPAVGKSVSGERPMPRPEVSPGGRAPDASSVAQSTSLRSMADKSPATADHTGPKTKPVGSEMPAAAGNKPVAQRPGVKTEVPQEKPTAADAVEKKKLAVQAKAAEIHAGLKPIGAGPALLQSNGPQPVARARTRAGAGATLRVFNRALATAAVLMFVIVVIELMAAKPVLPGPQESTGSPVIFPGTNVPPQALTNYLGAMLGRNIFESATNTVLDPKKYTPLDLIKKYIADNVKLEGVSPALVADQSFAAVTEKGVTRYLRIGAVLSIPVDAGTEKVKLDRIEKNEVVLLYDGQPIVLKGMMK